MGEPYEIRLPSGHVALVDAEDRELTEGWRWYAIPTPNTVYALGRRPGSRKGQLLHRVLLDPPADLEIDHRDGNGLDNRRSNLRLATRALNQANKRPARSNRSGYKGVCWHRGKWVARIKVNGQARHLGRFIDPWDAAQAYNAAAVEAWGEFARLNVRGI